MPFSYELRATEAVHVNDNGLLDGDILLDQPVWIAQTFHDELRGRFGQSFAGIRIGFDLERFSLLFFADTREELLGDFGHFEGTGRNDVDFVNAAIEHILREMRDDLFAESVDRTDLAFILDANMTMPAEAKLLRNTTFHLFGSLARIRKSAKTALTHSKDSCCATG